MKKLLRMLGIIAIVAIIGFSMAGCDNDPEPTPGGDPALTGTVSISGSAAVGQTLTAVTTSLGGSGTITYQWKRGSTIIGANQSTYLVVAADIGSTITVTVTRAGYTGSKTSDPTVAVTNPELPALTGTVSISGTAEVGQTLTAVTTSLNGSGDISYQWKRIGMMGNTDIGTNQSTYVVVAADIGSTITVTVTRSGNFSYVVSAPTAVVTDPNLPALTGTVSISGTPEAGQTLTAVTTSLGGSGTISYQWKSQGMMGGSYVTGTNSSTYVVDGDDEGHTITVTVTRTGNSGSVTSSPTAAVTLPALTGTVSISGTAHVGQTLTAVTTSLGGSGSIAYSWTRIGMMGNTDIGGGSTYQVQDDDAGSTITVTVTRGGYTGSKTSSPTAVVLIPVTFNTILEPNPYYITTEFYLSFDSDIPLTIDDITLSGVAGVTKVSLDNYGGSYYRLTIGNVAPGNLTVTVSKSGYYISPPSRTVQLFKPVSVTLTATANGSAGVTTTTLTLTFSQAIPGLTAADIELTGTGGTGVQGSSQMGTIVLGAISGSGPVYTLPITSFTVGAANQGFVFIGFMKEGYTWADAGPVTFYKAP
jgi:hypothetical protein